MAEEGSGGQSNDQLENKEDLQKNVDNVRERSCSSVEFDEHIIQFHMALADQKIDDAVDALMKLRWNTINSTSTDPELLNVRREMIKDCERKALGLKDEILERLKKASQTLDEEQAFHYFSLAENLGVGRQAADLLVMVLEKVYEKKAKAAVEKIQQSKSTAGVGGHGYTDRQAHIASLYEIMGEASRFIRTVDEYSSDPHIRRAIISPVHAICIKSAVDVIATYMQDARVSVWERRSIAYQKRDLSQEATLESDESIQMIDLVLDEVACVLQVCVHYLNFISTQREKAGLSDETSMDIMQKKQLELGGVYVVLERYYIFQTVSKAIEITEPQETEPGVFVSSSVEDICYVLDKAFSRSSQTLTYTSALSVLIAIIDVLETMYLPAVLNLPHRDFQIPIKTDLPEIPREENEDEEELTSFSDAFLTALDEDLSKNLQDEAKLVVAINSAYSSVEHIKRLQGVVEECSGASFPSDPVLLNCVPKPITEVSRDFQLVVDNGINALLEKCLKPDLKKLLARVMEPVTYEITSERYDYYEIHSSAVSIFLQKTMQHPGLLRSKASLSEPAFNCFMQAFATFITEELETIISTKAFNDWGAMLLEKEVRLLLTKFTQLTTNTSLRSQFTKLHHTVHRLITETS